MTTTTDPTTMTAKERRQFVAAHAAARHTHDCCYGHLGCSVTQDGPCLDEVMGYMEEMGEDDNEQAGKEAYSGMEIT